ncbi:MAG: hypothetical protein ACTSV5_13115 [Promethearchaeota archaeon]
MITKVKSGYKTINTSRVDVDCRGSGTLDDPVIFDSSTKLPKWFWIDNSQSHLKIYECNNYSIGLFNSQNITVKNCSLNSLHFSNCSNNIIESCLKIKKLGIYMSNNNVINRSTITKLKMSRSNDNTIQECIITKIKYRNNNENTFIDNNIPDEMLLKTEKQLTFVSLNLNKIIIVIIEIGFYIAMYIFMILYHALLWLEILFLIIFSLVIFIPPRIARKILEKRRGAKSSTNG